MNAAIFARVVWKESRTLAGLWLAILFGTLFLTTLFIWVMPWFGGTMSGDQTEGAAGLALLMPVFFALGASAVLFASEQEDRTDEWYRLWGAPAGTVLSAKFFTAVVATVGLGVLLSLGAALIAGNWIDLSKNDDARGGLTFVGVGLIELFAWGCFTSLLIKKTLPAIVAAVAANGVCVGLVVEIGNKYFGPTAALADAYYPPRVVVAAIVLLIDVVLGWRWLAGRSGQRWRAAEIGDEVASYASWRERWGVARQFRDGGTPFSRLLLFETRRAVWPVLVIVVAGLVWFGLWTREPRDPRYQIQGRDTALMIGAITALVLGVYAGRDPVAGTRFGFFANRGAGPWALFASKLRVWGLALLVIEGLLGAAFVWIYGPEGFSGRFLAPTALMPIVFFTMSFWTALVIPGVVVASFLSFVVSGAAGVWLLLMNENEIPYLFSVFPLPLAALVASYVRLNDLLDERTGWRTSLKGVAILLAPFPFILVGVAAYRVYDVPLVAEPSISVLYETVGGRLRFIHPNPEMAETAALYAKAREALRSAEQKLEPDEKRDWGAARYDAAFELALTAAKRPDGYVIDLNRDSQSEQLKILAEVSLLSELLSDRAVQSTKAGKLVEALEINVAMFRLASHTATNGNLMVWNHATRQLEKCVDSLAFWAGRPEQTEARLIAARVALGKFLPSRYPTATDAAQRSYLEAIDLARRGYAGMYEDFEVNQSSSTDKSHELSTRREAEMRLLRWVDNAVFWERYRRERIVNLTFAELLAKIKRREELLRSSLTTIASDSRDDSLFPDSQAAWKFRSAQWLIPNSSALELPDQFAEKERLVWLVLALNIKAKQDGKLPDQLAAILGPWPLLKAIPVDPFSGSPYGYFPRGGTLRFHGEPKELETPMDFPFLWASGPGRTRLWPALEPMERTILEVFDEHGRLMNYGRPGSRMIYLR